MSVNNKRQFIYDLENTALDKLILKDKFNTINSTRLLWGLAKFTNRHLNPYFNSDSASCILNRYSLAKVRTVSHRVPHEVIKTILDQKKITTFKNMGLGLYSLASMDFYDQEYFESVFTSHLNQETKPDLSSLAKITQACATLRRSEYTNVLASWLVEAISLEEVNGSLWNMSKERDLISALQATLFLLGSNEEALDKFKSAAGPLLDTFLKHFLVELSEDHILVIPSLLWSVSCLGLIPEHEDLVQNCLRIVNDKMEEHGSVSYPGSVLLN